MYVNTYMYLRICIYISVYLYTHTYIHIYVFIIVIYLFIYTAIKEWAAPIEVTKALQRFHQDISSRVTGIEGIHIQMILFAYIHIYTYICIYIN
jgi:hypothetical protein